MDKVKKLWCYKRKFLILMFKSVRFPKPQILLEIFWTNLQTPVWSRDVGVHPRYIWNLLWLSKRLIICAEQTSIYISTFPNTLTSECAKNHEISISFLTNAFVALSRTAITVKFKMSRLFEKWEKTNNKRTTTTSKAKGNGLNLKFIDWYNDLDSFHLPKTRKRVINSLLIDYKKCSQRQNSLSTSIRFNFLRLQM